MMGLPFVKVEASKYTEVGFEGRDVESMIRDFIWRYKFSNSWIWRKIKDKIDDEVNRRIIEKLFHHFQKLQSDKRVFY